MWARFRNYFLFRRLERGREVLFHFWAKALLVVNQMFVRKYKKNLVEKILFSRKIMGQSLVLHFDKNLPLPA